MRKAFRDSNGGLTKDEIEIYEALVDNEIVVKMPPKTRRKIEAKVNRIEEDEEKVEKLFPERDWTGNKTSTWETLGVRFETKQRRDFNETGKDFYATDPRALEKLLEVEKFENVWECADGMGHLCNILREKGILGRHSDIVYRGCEGSEIIDFLKYDGKWEGDIITNPPYKYALEFILKALEIVKDGRKIAFLLRLQFLEGVKRYKELYLKFPPKVIYVFVKRTKCGLNGDFTKSENAISFAWFVWEKGYKGETRIKWLL
jgi:hypothetical protein